MKSALLWPFRVSAPVEKRKKNAGSQLEPSDAQPRQALTNAAALPSSSCKQSGPLVFWHKRRARPCVRAGNRPD